MCFTSVEYQRILVDRLNLLLVLFVQIKLVYMVNFVEFLLIKILGWISPWFHQALSFILRWVVNITIMICVETSHFAKQLKLIHGLKSVLALCEICPWSGKINSGLTIISCLCSTTFKSLLKTYLMSQVFKD